jgi:hypothetical protein
MTIDLQCIKIILKHLSLIVMDASSRRPAKLAQLPRNRSGRSVCHPGPYLLPLRLTQERKALLAG